MSGEARSPSLPNVPTMSEAGQPKYKAVGWFGLMAPAGTPAPIVARVERCRRRGRAKARRSSPDCARKGIEPASSRPQEFAVFVREQLELHKQLVEDVDLKLAQ